jgi:NAD-dependent SIR2 family protein deacetylase
MKETTNGFHFLAEKGGDMAEAYCVKCKAKREVANATEVTMKNGRPALKGVCPTCGTGLYKILPMKK